MKTIVILFGVMAAVSAAEQVTFKIPQEIADKIQKQAQKCAEEYKVDPSVIVKVPTETIPDDEAVSKFVFCFAFKLGHIDSDGHAVVERLSSVVKDHPLVGEFKEALIKCNEETRETPEATAMAVQKCFIRRTPIRLLF